MGSFCSSCGAVTGGGKFCPTCGSPQTPVGAQVVNPPVTRGSPVLKIVLLSIAVLFLLGMIGAVRAFYYVKDRVHEEVAQIKHDSGLSDARARAQPTHAGCEILSREKAADILGVTVARAEGNEAGDAREFCKYWPEGAKAGEQTKEEPDFKDLEALIKGISSAASAHRPLLTVTVSRGNAKVAMSVIKATGDLFAGHKAQTMEGPWDEAYFGPFDAVLAVRKGDTGIFLDLSKVAQKREKGEELARAMIAAL